MEQEKVLQAAQAHGEATVSGDLKRAGSDLDKRAYGAAGEVMKQMPEGLSSSEVVESRADGNEWVVTIRYRGQSDAVLVESRWSESEGEPKIIDLKVV